MSHKARHIANAFLKVAKQDDRSISPLALQGLVYYSHAWMLALHDRPLIDELVQAWPSGAVIESLYHETKCAGSEPLSGYLNELDWQSGKIGPMIPGSSETTMWEIIRGTWEKYGKLSPAQVTGIAQREGSPWHAAVSAKSQVISNDAIREYHLQLRQRAMAAQA